MNAWIYVGGVAVMAALPIVGVVLGSRAFDADNDEETESETCTDDTVPLPRITDSGPYSH
jgi:hypothetical protein